MRKNPSKSPHGKGYYRQDDTGSGIVAANFERCFTFLPVAPPKPGFTDPAKPTPAEIRAVLAWQTDVAARGLALAVPTWDTRRKWNCAQFKFDTLAQVTGKDGVKSWATVTVTVAAEDGHSGNEWRGQIMLSALLPSGARHHLLPVSRNGNRPCGCPEDRRGMMDADILTLTNGRDLADIIRATVAEAPRTLRVAVASTPGRGIYQGQHASHGVGRVPVR